MHNKVDGDGNCLYHAIAHQAGFIEQSCHEDTLVAKMLRILALHFMQNYPDVCIEDGTTQLQWGRKRFGFCSQLNGEVI